MNSVSSNPTMNLMALKSSLKLMIFSKEFEVLSDEAP